MLIATDNGIGFDLPEVTGQLAKTLSGNGLKSMNSRAKEMKGALLIDSKPGRGTSITLMFPLT